MTHPDSFDVFISYAHVDEAWVRVLVASASSLERPWVQEEYAAMLTRAVAGNQRLIPLLIEDVELTPFLASRVWVDFRGADGPGYDKKLQELLQALKGPPGPPPRTGQLKRPPGTLELALEVTDPELADLPWETLRLNDTAGSVLALHPRVALHRLVPLEGPAPAISIPGPLRVLVAVGSPEAQNARGELLDMEAELGRILDAIEKARERASVRILEQGSLENIREALEQARYHQLYISCHARPGTLILEDAEGREDAVSARRLWEEALPAGRGVPLIVLAG